MHRLPLLIAATLLANDASARAPNNPWQAKAREILAASIPFKTTETHKQVPQYVDYLVGEFRKAGVPESQIKVLPVGDTRAMVVRIPGRDNAKKPILFSAHMDVVEADPKDWERDPFRFIEENGYFFGRGVLDDKAGVAMLATMIIRMSQEKLVPSRPLVFAFIGDEETTMRTTALLAGPQKALIDAEFALNADAGGGALDETTGKPLTYFIQGGEKTYSDFTLKVTDSGGHSSAPKAENPIYRLSAALLKIQNHRFPVASNGLTRSFFAAEAKTRGGEIGKAMADFAANPAEGAAAARLSSEPYLVGQVRTTCVATELKAGHAPNALPQSAEANVNCRIFPGEGVDATGKTLERVIGDPKVVVTAGMAGSIESPASEPRADVTAAVSKAVASSWGPVTVAYQQSAGATDGSHYRAAGIPTYGVTLLYMKESDEFAHGLNERIPADSFYKAIDSWWVLLKELADPR